MKLNKILLLLLFLFLLIGSVINRKEKVAIMKLKEISRLDVGRASIGVFEDYAYLGNDASIDNVTISSNENFSEKSFNHWLENRWEEIKRDDAEEKIEEPPMIFKPSPHSVWFKFSYIDIGKKGTSIPMFKGEGAIFDQNKVLFLAPGGSFGADKKIANILKEVSFNNENKNKAFCLGFYCINTPVSNNEYAEVSIKFPQYNRLMGVFRTETYTSEQEEYNSEYSSETGSYDSSFCYSNNEVKTIEGLKGRETICGMSEPSENGIETSIQAEWFYAGTQGDKENPAITITMVYEYETDHKPSKAGWFDDQTVKETGFTPEKFMSIWESTLTSFKRSR